jgi:hypothetical protein
MRLAPRPPSYLSRALFGGLYSLRHQRWLPLRVRNHLRLSATYIGVRRTFDPSLPPINILQILGFRQLSNYSSESSKKSPSKGKRSQIIRPSAANGSPEESHPQKLQSQRFL